MGGSRASVRFARGATETRGKMSPRDPLSGANTKNGVDHAIFIKIRAVPRGGIFLTIRRIVRGGKGLRIYRLYHT